MLRLLALLVVAAVLPFSQAQAADFTLSSPQFADGQGFTMKEVYNSFGCTGENISPALKWENAPEGTKSFAVTVFDPDAPTGSGWWQWVLFNIPAEVTTLEVGAGSPGGTLPDGVIQSLTDYGKPGYGGPCPPVGDKPHRYIFTVYALKDKLPLEATAMPALVGFMINANKLGEASFEVKYGRTK